MAINVTYYTGAGASAGSIPMVNGLTESFKTLSTSYSQTRKEFFKNLDEVEEFIKELDWLYSEAAKHATIDTLAKRYYLTRDNKKLKRLKVVLTIVFVIHQFKKDIDIRYDSILASLLERGNGGLQLPENVKFLTWNYDYQLELAARNYLGFYDFDHLQGEIKSFPRYEFLGDVPDYYSTSIVHLNGIAGVYRVPNGGYKTLFDLIDNEKDEFENLEKILYIQESSRRERIDLNDLFSFSWEQNKVSEKSLELAIEIGSNTNILVIIGYSFPFFNRSHDRKIFEAMTKTHQLKKIYFQNPNLDGEFLRAQFNIPDYVNIEHIKDTYQFFIPHEL